MHAQIEKQIKINKAAVLTKSVQRLATELGLSRHELSLIIGRSEATFSRLFKNDAPKSNKATCLDPSSKEGQLAVLLLRLFRNLDVLFGGNSKQSQLWLRSTNEHLDNKKPIDLIITIEGLVTVVQYLDAIRGKN